jgi:hypothetical protein
VKEPAAARNIAFCIAQLSLSDKALRKLGDIWKTYHLALCDEAVLGYFKVCAAACEGVVRQGPPCSLAL